MADLIERDETEVPMGQVVWHSSDEDGGPDVGVSLRIADGVDLWVGEITDQAWRDASPRGVVDSLLRCRRLPSCRQDRAVRWARAS